MRKPIARAARLSLLMLAVAAAAVWFLHGRNRSPLDDAKVAGKSSADFPETASHAFDAMDGGQRMSEGARKGRDTWLLWTAGDQVFWNGMAQHSFGISDLLKVVDSRRHQMRFQNLGVVNEPGFAQVTQPDQFGLWLDTGPQETGVDPAIYGRPSGIVGLRIYPNPNFDGAARKRWDPERYFSDPRYYDDPKLVRPYTVGMACGFCHVAFNPVNPPADPDKPTWANLSSTIGNQYLNSSTIFGNGAPPDSFPHQVFRTWPRGAVDTSFLATDDLNNPSRINSIFAIAARLTAAHEEDISGGALHFPGATGRMAIPHVLKDGADSVGLTGALSRVYVSIGEFSQQWLLDHKVLVGIEPQRPFSVALAQANSTYWLATAQRLPNMEQFLMAMSGPRLQSAPGGRAYLMKDARQLQRGKIVFAENCAQCHSSKQPPAGSMKTREQYLDWMRAEVVRPDFLQDNFLSTEKRIPVNVVGTNACRALATNAMRGHIWDNFSSETYKNLPSVGEIDGLNPLDGSTYKFQAKGGGPGYYRVPSLIGIWATAPLLHNDSIGLYTGDPSVAGRMKAFNDAITKLLWPDKRLGLGSIPRTTEASYIDIPSSYLPRELQPVTQSGFLRIGPIPAGTPVDLLANGDWELSSHGTTLNLLALVTKVQADLAMIMAQHMNPDEARRKFENLIPDLLKISKCPDFVVDRGHYFGTSLPDRDKRALIEFIKTF